jgi:uncharacterized protein YndB with AHSA1/START domain
MMSRALTDPELLGRWLMPNDFKLERGHRFTFRTTPMPAVGFDGVVRCRVLAMEDLRLLRLSWCGGRGLDSTLTWRLEPEGLGTRLFLEHTGFDPDNPIQRRAHERMGNGWRTDVLQDAANLRTRVAARGEDTFMADEQERLAESAPDDLAGRVAIQVGRGGGGGALVRRVRGGAVGRRGADRSGRRRAATARRAARRRRGISGSAAPGRRLPCPRRRPPPRIGRSRKRDEAGR